MTRYYSGDPEQQAAVDAVDEETTIRRLHRAGASDAAIARELGVSRDVARARRVALDLPAVGRAGRPAEGETARDHKVWTTLTADELEEVCAAVGEGSRSAWVREAILRAARRW